jgi:hypothetical protein
MRREKLEWWGEMQGIIKIKKIKMQNLKPKFAPFIDLTWVYISKKTKRNYLGKSMQIFKILRIEKTQLLIRKLKK